MRFAQNEVISLIDWSQGDGATQGVTYTPGELVHGPYREADGRDYVLIALDRMYARDEELPFRTERLIHDAFPASSERVSIVALDSTSLLRLTVLWPIDRPPNAVRLRIAKADGEFKIENVAAAVLDKTHDGRVTYTKEVPDPELGGRTSVEWDWEPLTHRPASREGLDRPR